MNFKIHRLFHLKFLSKLRVDLRIGKEYIDDKNNVLILLNQGDCIRSIIMIVGYVSNMHYDLVIL